jgi:hypothetical protein
MQGKSAENFACQKWLSGRVFRIMGGFLQPLSGKITPVYNSENRY